MSEHMNQSNCQPFQFKLLNINKLKYKSQHNPFLIMENLFMIGMAWCTRIYQRIPVLLYSLFTLGLCLFIVEHERTLLHCMHKWIVWEVKGTRMNLQRFHHCHCIFWCLIDWLEGWAKKGLDAAINYIWKLVCIQVLSKRQKMQLYNSNECNYSCS